MIEIINLNSLLNLNLPTSLERKVECLYYILKGSCAISFYKFKLNIDSIDSNCVICCVPCASNSRLFLLLDNLLASDKVFVSGNDLKIIFYSDI